MDEENDPIIIDIGSGHLKAGFASDDAPKNLIPMVLGKPKSKGALVGMEKKEWYIGQEALSKKYCGCQFYDPKIVNVSC
jgi:actin